MGNHAQLVAWPLVIVILAQLRPVPNAIMGILRLVINAIAGVLQLMELVTPAVLREARVELVPVPVCRSV